MLRMTCDRCGREVPREEFVVERQGRSANDGDSTRVNNIVRVDLAGTRLRADLCNSCQAVLKTDLVEYMERWPQTRP